MPIEALLTRLCEGTERHNELLEQMLEAGGKTPAAAASKPAAKPAAKKAPAKKPAAKKGPTAEEFVAKFGAFLKAGDADDRENAKVAVKNIVDHFEAPKVSEIDAANYEEALGYLAQYEAGEDPFGGEEEEEGGSLL
jgi:hypothetical protein